MDWRGRPLTSHEVIVNSIAATTTRTGLKVHAELDTNTYATGGRIADGQMDALPLNRHEWHGDWNYALHPEEYAQVSAAPDPFDQPSPHLAWLCHPALTGLPSSEWDALITTLTTLHEAQRETELDKRRGHRPRAKGDGGTGRRSILTLADRLLATLLHYRLSLRHMSYDPFGWPLDLLGIVGQYLDTGPRPAPLHDHPNFATALSTAPSSFEPPGW